MRTEIRRKDFQIVGYVETDLNGKKTIRDSSYGIVGYYEPQRNVTLDRNFQIIAYGDVSGIFFKDKIYF